MSKSTKIMVVFGVAAALGVAALPLASYAATTATQDVSVTVGDAMAITATNTDMGSTIPGGETSGGENNISIQTNKIGAKVYIKATTSTDLSDGNSHTIPAGTLTGTTSSWGYKTVGGTTWTAITTSNALIYTTVAADATNEAINKSVVFGAKISASQVSGTYTGNVTYTISAS